MKIILFLIAVAALVSCNGVGMPTDYKGTDAGYVVIGVGAQPEGSFQSYSLIFKSLTTGRQGSFTFMQGSILKDSPQYQDSFGVGVVKVASIPAGKYEIFNYSSYRGTGQAGTEYSAKNNFSIPFEVKPGETIYLGNYQAVTMQASGSFGIPISNWKGFRIKNGAEHDLSIAKKNNKEISIKEFTNASPDPIKLSEPTIF